MSKPRTARPLPPPYPVGTKLECVTNRPGSTWARARADAPQYPNAENGNDGWTMTFGRGLVVTIEEVHKGTRGTGALLDADDEIYDETRDGTSVYYIETWDEFQNKPRRLGRLIHARDKKEWKVIK